MKTIRMTLLTMLVVGATIGLARAQGVSQVPAARDGWNVAVYPVLVWIPLDIGTVSYTHLTLPTIYSV